MNKQNVFQRLMLMFLILTSSCYSALSYAHPHSWIDIKTKILGQGNVISGLSMSWSFDDMTSMYLLDDEDMSQENAATTLQLLADGMLENMNRVHFMTYLGQDTQQPQAVAAVGKGKLVQDGLRLVLHFQLRLITPLTVSEAVSLRIFDPSYYTDMNWLAAGDVVLDEELTERCKVNVIAHQASAKQLAYAMALPASAETDNNLGAQFTQQAEIQCR